MDEYESLSHTAWECKYHVVFIPKCRRKTLYKQLRPHLGEVFRRLAGQKESRIEEGYLLIDHVHMLIAIPPKMRGVTGGRLYISRSVASQQPHSFAQIHRHRNRVRHPPPPGRTLKCPLSGASCVD